MAIYNKYRYPINNSTWTAISPKIDTTGWGLKSSTSTAFKIRTDPNDANTEDTVAAGNQEICNPAFSRLWRTTDTILYAQSTVASDTLILTAVT